MHRSKSIIATLFICVLSIPAWLSAQEDDFEVLFDGSSLDKWRGYHHEEIGEGWSVTDDGALHFAGSKGGDIVTKEEFTDFELRFDWKVSPGANSGVMYRVGLGDGASYFSGPEYQILDDSKHNDGGNAKTSAAALYALYAPENKKLKKSGEWNEGRIIVDGSRVEHWLNGEKVIETDMASVEWKDLVAASKFAKWEKFGKLPSGRICLQDHGNPVWFKNIKIKRLNEDK